MVNVTQSSVKMMVFVKEAVVHVSLAFMDPYVLHVSNYCSVKFSFSQIWLFLYIQRSYVLQNPKVDVPNKQIDR